MITFKWYWRFLVICQALAIPLPWYLKYVFPLLLERGRMEI